MSLFFGKKINYHHSITNKYITMKLSFLMLLTAVLLFNSCKPEKPATGNLKIIFKAEYNNNPLVMYDTNATNLTDPTQISISKLEFFLSEIQATATQVTTLKEVDYISLNGTTTKALAEEGTSILLTAIPIGSYHDLGFKVGVTKAIDNTVPSDYPSTSPLGINGNYWSSWNSYISSRIEGNITKADQTTSSFLYHAGVEGMFQQCQFNTSFEISADQTATVVITIQAEDFFFDSNNPIDVINDNSTHSGAVGSAGFLLAQKSIKNLGKAMIIK